MDELVARDEADGRCAGQREQEMVVRRSEESLRFVDSRRMIEELKYAGNNGAVVSVVCEGSALYPSQLLEPTPKYDMGQFFATGP